MSILDPTNNVKPATTVAATMSADEVMRDAAQRLTNISATLLGQRDLQVDYHCTDEAISISVKRK